MVPTMLKVVSAAGEIRMAGLLICATIWFRLCSVYDGRQCDKQIPDKVMSMRYFSDK